MIHPFKTNKVITMPHGILKLFLGYGTSEQIHPGFARGRKNENQVSVSRSKSVPYGTNFGGTSLCRIRKLFNQSFLMVSFNPKSKFT